MDNPTPQLSIWLGPVLSFLGVVLGFIVNAIFNRANYKKQIELLKKQTELKFEELQKQIQLNSDYRILEKTLSWREAEMEDCNEEIRACLKNSGMHKWRGIFAPIEARNRRHTLCMARLSNEEWHKKTRQLGVLSFFKQALELM